RAGGWAELSCHAAGWPALPCPRAEWPALPSPEAGGPVDRMVRRGRAGLDWARRSWSLGIPPYSSRRSACAGGSVLGALAAGCPHRHCAATHIQSSPKGLGLLGFGGGRRKRSSSLGPLGGTGQLSPLSSAGRAFASRSPHSIASGEPDRSRRMTGYRSSPATRSNPAPAY